MLKVMYMCKKRPTKETSRCELFRGKVRDYIVEPRYCKYDKAYVHVWNAT